MSDVAFWGPGDDPALAGFREALRTEWLRRGSESVEGTDPSAACVFNFVNPDDPKPFRRRQRSTYVIAVHTVPEAPPDVLRPEYPMLVRALANLSMLVVPGDACYFVTPEQGVYSVPDPGDLDDRDRWGDRGYRRQRFKRDHGRRHGHVPGPRSDRYAHG